MKLNRSMAASASVLALAAMASLATSVAAHPIYLPYHRGATPPDPNRPLVHVGPYEAPYVAPKSSSSGTWTDVANVPFTGQGGWGPLQLTDGSVIIKHAFTGTTAAWYKLSPSKKGKYTNGKWK